MIYKPKNFRIEELVPENVFKVRGEKCWELLSERLLRSLQEIREYVNRPMILNDWLWKGNRQNQVLRVSDYYESVSYSQHLRGYAADVLIEGMGPRESRELIIQMKRKGKIEFVTAIEDKVDWLHFDCRETERVNEDGLFIFEP